MKEFLVVRGQLAVSLIEAGIKYRTTTNPFKNGWTAWLFELNDDSRRIAAEFYREIGKPVPHILRIGGNTVED